MNGVPEQGSSHFWGDGLRHFVDFLFYRRDSHGNDYTGRREAGRELQQQSLHGVRERAPRRSGVQEVPGKHLSGTLRMLPVVHPLPAELPVQKEEAMKLAYHSLYGDKQYTYIVRPSPDGRKWKAMRKKRADYRGGGRRTWRDIKGIEWMDSQEEAEKVLESYAGEKGLQKII